MRTDDYRGAEQNFAKETELQGYWHWERIAWNVLLHPELIQKDDVNSISLFQNFRLTDARSIDDHKIPIPNFLHHERHEHGWSNYTITGGILSKNERNCKNRLSTRNPNIAILFSSKTRLDLAGEKSEVTSCGQFRLLRQDGPLFLRSWILPQYCIT